MSRVLVVANETVGAEELLDEIRRIQDEKSSEYYVMVPAHPLHERHGALWSQEGAQDAANERLSATLAALRSEGLEATGTVGDMRPLAAIGDALMDFSADLIVISTHPIERSRWLRLDIVEQTKRKFGLPVRHVISTVEEAAAAERRA